MNSLNEASWRAMADAIPHLAWIADEHGWIYWYNQRWYDYTGATLEQMRGWGWQSVHHPDHVDRVLEFVGRAWKAGEPWELTFPLRAADGSYRWFLTRAQPVRDDAGRLVRWLGTNTDITAQVHADSALAGLNAELERRVQERTRESDALAALSAALEQARTPEGVAHAAAASLAASARVDALVLWRVAGDRAERLGVYGEARAALEDLPDFMHREGSLVWRADELGRAVYVNDVPSHPAVVEGYKRGGFRTAAYLPTGDTRAVVVCLRRSRDAWADGDRRLLDAAARSIGLALERAEFTRELQARTAELEARTAELEAFAHTVSHDLRTPLLAIEGMTGVLVESAEAADAEGARFAAARVKRNVETMGRLLDDVLTLSRISYAAEPAEPLELGRVALTVLGELAGRIEARGARVDVPAAWPRVVYASSEAYQVIANLVGNAVKWAGAGDREPVVRVSCVARDDDVELRVEDNGPGVPERHRDRVFGLFQRLDAHAEGTGVGLAIVKRIVERRGGRVWIEDSSLGGAAFVVTMPAAR